MLKLSRFSPFALTFKFLRTLLCNLCRWSCAFDICLANIFLKTHQYILLALLFLHLKHLEAALLCVVKGILLDIGSNLWHSLVLQSQISNFPYSLKNLSPVRNYFRWRILRFHYTWNRKRIVFCYSFNVLLFSKNQIRLLCQTPNGFSTVKLALCAQSLCLLLYNNFLVFNISDNCWKSSYNLWMLSNHNSLSPEGLGFQACYSAPSQYLTAPFSKPDVLGKQYGKVFSLRWRINHFALTLLR